MREIERERQMVRELKIEKERQMVREGERVMMCVREGEWRASKLGRGSDRERRQWHRVDIGCI